MSEEERKGFIAGLERAVSLVDGLYYSISGGDGYNGTMTFEYDQNPLEVLQEELERVKSAERSEEGLGEIKLFVDGGVIGKNPSTEGVYWSVGQDMPDGTHRVLTERAESREHFTNNEAEYLALLDALNRAMSARKGTKVIIHSDSQLIVNQFNGRWKCGEERLAILLEACQQAAEFLSDAGIEVEVIWVSRNENVKRLGH